MSLNYLFLTLSLMSDIADPGAEAPLTFGQKAVGLTFNPGNNPDDLSKTVDSIFYRSSRQYA